jgi:UPF0755 protein
MRKPVIVLIVLLILLSAAGAVGWFSLKSSVSQPHAHQAAEKIITIQPRTGTAAIIAQLRREGVLASEWPTVWWMRLAARGQSFKSGSYEFKSPITPLEIISKLTRGEVATRSLTIPEGYNQWDIAAKLGAPLPGMSQPPPASQDEILALFRKKVELISDLDPQARDLEGYLFPDTYEYTINTTREQLIDAMVKRFRKVYTPELQQQAAALGMTTRQAITMASLVEKEAKVDSERETISQVYHKRWKMGERLACDPTVIYAALLVGKYKDKKIHQSDLDRDSPYNTYKLPGLPPGPIASPGKRSISAALNPAKTDYFYFVVDVTKNDGSHKFSESSRDHESAVKLLRQAEREQAAQKATQPSAQK